MEAYDIQNLTTAEIQLKMRQLSDKFEATKAKILTLCNELEDLDKENEKLQNELKIRQNYIY